MENDQEWSQEKFNKKYPKTTKGEIKVEYREYEDSQKQLIIKNYPELERLYFHDVQSIGKIILKNLPQLQECTIWECETRDLTIENCPQLKKLKVRKNLLTSLDFLKNLENLEEFDWFGNDKLVEILGPYNENNDNWRFYKNKHMTNITPEDKELNSYAGELQSVRDKIEQLNENLENLVDNQKNIEDQIKEKEREIKKASFWKERTKWSTTSAAALTVASSITSGSLSLVGYSQQSGYVSFAVSTTSGIASFISSMANDNFSNKENDLIKQKADLEKKLEKEVADKKTRDLRSWRENWSELGKIVRNLHLLQSIVPEETKESLVVFLQSFTRKLEKRKLGSDGQPLKDENDNFIYEKDEHDNPVYEEKELDVEDLKRKWEEHGISQKIEDLVEKVDDYLQMKNQSVGIVSSTGVSFQAISKALPIVSKASTIDVKVEQPKAKVLQPTPPFNSNN
jgi:hypothetical protein